MSSSPRRRAREFALQGLYQWLLSGNDPAAIRGQLAESAGFARCDNKLFDRLWQGVTAEYDALQSAYAPYLDRKPGEVSPIEKSILTIGAWELLHAPDVPFKVAINEAVELAKRYGSEESGAFVNGVLDQVAKKLRPSEAG